MRMVSETSESVAVTASAVDITPTQDEGILKTIIKPGDGNETPAEGVRVQFHYIGKVKDGKEFENSRAEDKDYVDFNAKPLNFLVGEQSDLQIKAWDICIRTMKKNEIACFECKPDYAYGEEGKFSKIPPNATLIFEIEVFGWDSDLTTERDEGIQKVATFNIGTGNEKPKIGSTVDIHVTGEYNGRVFDDRDVKYPLGEGAVNGICVGIEEALKKFKKKEKSKLKIKSQYAFGCAGKTEFDIPPNADVEYTITLNSFEKLKEYKEATEKELIEQAEYVRDRGTEFYKEGKFDEAVKMYKRIEGYMAKAEFIEIDKVWQQGDLMATMYLNLAMCYLKMNQCNEAKEACEKVLETQPKNRKAIYRRGMSLMNLGEPELALRDFERIAELEPKNAAAINNIQRCKVMIQKQRRQTNQLYSNIAGKFTK